MKVKDPFSTNFLNKLSTFFTHTLYTLLSDAPMRPGVTTQEVVVQAVNGFVEPLPTGTDQALAALCRSALAPDPAERLPTIDAFVTKLRRWLDTRESRALTERAMETLAELEVLRTLSATQQQEAVRILGVFEQAGRNGAGDATSLLTLEWDGTSLLNHEHDDTLKTWLGEVVSALLPANDEDSVAHNTESQWCADCLTLE